MQEAVGKIHFIGKDSRKVLIYVPVDIVIDSSFPFKEDQKRDVDIIIDGDSLIVKKRR